MAEATNPNEAGEVAPSVAEESAPSTDSPVATDIPSANAPDPTALNPETSPNAAEEKTAKKPAAKPAGDAAKPAAAKKEKAPAVEDKPFAEFIQQDFMPALTAKLAKQGVEDLELTLAKEKIPVIGYADAPECSQIIGRWNDGWREFRVYFIQDNLQGPRGFSYAENKGKPSTIEPFLIDERKITLDLLLFGVVQRLNGQKWLVRN
ncbi:DUF2996 domain-containing protein [Microseira sp. BLCC-F43]|uniref:DUF2996 domain-containing protein n=1 Tax=Microseira sp. BLCC-F43 TaxID=3153602 RepID=UPI0035B7F7BA